jgi:PhnB protein
MELNSCINLSFDGRCEAAFQFYEKCLGGKITFTPKWGDSPMANDAPAEWAGKMLHARFQLGDLVLNGCDVPPGQYERARGSSLLLGPDDPADAERLFSALAENGSVWMPLQETFWAERFGGVTDQYGIPWEINCQKHR